MAKIILNRLKIIAEEVLPERQCGFGADRATDDMIFTLRQLQKKAVEQQQLLYIHWSLLISPRRLIRWTEKLCGRCSKYTNAQIDKDRVVP